MLCPTFPSSPCKHLALAFASKLQRETYSERASKEQCRKGVFGAHIQAETKLNEELTWDYYVCKTCALCRAEFPARKQKSTQGDWRSLVWVPTSLGLCPPNCSCKYATCISEWQNKDAIIFVREKMRICLLVFFLHLCMYLFWTFTNIFFEENNNNNN